MADRKGWTGLPIVESMANWLANLGFHFLGDQWKKVDPDSWKAAVYYKQHNPVEFRGSIIVVGQGLSLLINALPLKRLPIIGKYAEQLLHVIDEVIEQAPDGAGEYFAGQRVVFEDGYKPSLGVNEIGKKFTDWVTTSASTSGRSFTSYVRSRIHEFPTWSLDRLFPKGDSKRPELERHLAAVELLNPLKRRKWNKLVIGLSPRGQELLREHLGILGTTDAIDRLLEVRAAELEKYLESYAPESPIEDFYQGVGAAIDPHLDRANRGLRRALRAF